MALTKSDLEQIEDLLDQKFQEFEEKLTKFRSDIYEKLDPILQEILASREEQTILSHKVSDHEDRIITLEAAS